jgi:hypothetical protein
MMMYVVTPPITYKQLIYSLIYQIKDYLTENTKV